MKKIIHILFILMLVLAFSSCSKTETEGFEDIVISSKAKVDSDDGITEEDDLRTRPGSRSSEGDDDPADDEDDNITDEEEDEDNEEDDTITDEEEDEDNEDGDTITDEEEDEDNEASSVIR